MRRNILYFIATAIIFSLGGMFSSCSRDIDEVALPDDGMTTIKILMPTQFSPGTRAVSALEENKISDIDLLVFDNSNRFLYRSKGSNLTDDNASGSIKKFKAIVTNSPNTWTQVKFVVIANARAQLDALDLQIGYNYSTLQSAITFTSAGACRRQIRLVSSSSQCGVNLR